ncbi:serine hydrolase [Cytobacillus solani]|uniref:serine hydrolase n=1 Tax=Cytobacillus solani TaxID=1637975 RepID=UPI000A87CC83|nr:serine hydrolase [Cytobacillus solani]USK55448.1 class A beta-lactamase-related serine hydrolase [Cytobacillus solani]
MKKIDFDELREKVYTEASRCKGRVGLIIEAEDKRIEINSEGRFSSASLIKVPILVECFRQSGKGTLDLQQSIQIALVEKVGGAGVLQALSGNLKLKIIDLMTLMIIVSDNLATNLLIDLLGMDQINQGMKELNLHQTELNRKMMDFTALNNGVDNYTTASDMLTCLKEICQNKILSNESASKAKEIMENQQFNNKLSDQIDLDIFKVANKTGELLGIEHDCAIIQYENRNVYAAVLIDQLTVPKDGRQTLSSIGQLISQFLQYS